MAPKEPISQLRHFSKVEAVEISKHNGPYKNELVWKNIILIPLLHLLALYGGWLMLSGKLMWQTNLFFVPVLFASGFGITAGAHRLWSHRCYKAKLPLQLILLTFNCLALQGTLINWSRDHRVHHKFTDTNADPYTATRGFFFSHVGWLMVRKHPDVKKEGKKINMSDLTSDPLLKFQHQHYLPLALTCCFVLPTIIPWYCWGESWGKALLVLGAFRYALSLNFTWSVNSVAHIWGNKPYDQTVTPVQNRFVALVAVGEGWHNYHHAFPSDYKTAEFGDYRLNFTTLLIDLMAKIGWAYDLKTAPPELIKKRMERTGDRTTAYD